MRPYQTLRTAAGSRFAPASAEDAEAIEIPRGPNIKRPPEHTPLGDSLEACVATVQPDDISTGGLAPDGVEVMAYRSYLRNGSTNGSD